ncbi:hypothetical protein ACAD32_00111 [Clavibacter nebraskensis]
MGESLVTAHRAPPLTTVTRTPPTPAGPRSDRERDGIRTTRIAPAPVARDPAPHHPSSRTAP